MKIIELIVQSRMKFSYNDQLTKLAAEAEKLSKSSIQYRDALNGGNRTKQ